MSVYFIWKVCGVNDKLIKPFRDGSTSWCSIRDDYAHSTEDFLE